DRPIAALGFQRRRRPQRRAEERCQQWGQGPGEQLAHGQDSLMLEGHPCGEVSEWPFGPAKATRGTSAPLPSILIAAGPRCRATSGRIAELAEEWDCNGEAGSKKNPARAP